MECHPLDNKELKSLLLRPPGRIFLYGINFMTTRLEQKFRSRGTKISGIFDTFKNGVWGSYQIQDAGACIKLLGEGDTLIICAQRSKEIFADLTQSGLSPECKIYDAYDPLLAENEVATLDAAPRPLLDKEVQINKAVTDAKSIQLSPRNRHITEKRPQIYAITLYGRSGSFLLSSLLDGHPQIAQADFLNFNSVLASAHYYLSISDGIEDPGTQFGLARIVAPLFQDASNPDSFPHFLAAFFSYLTEFKDKYYDMLDLLYIVTECYMDATGVSTDEDCVLVWQRHGPFQPEFEDVIKKEQWPITNLAILRRPADTLDSHVKASLNDYKSGTLLVSYIMYDLLVRSAVQRPESMEKIGVLFEDVHCHTEQTMKALSSAMGIRYDPCLLESTKLGAPYEFPTPGKLPPIVGTDPKRAQPKNFRSGKTTLHWATAAAVQEVLREEYTSWGYGDNRTWFEKLVSQRPSGLKLLVYYGFLSQAFKETFRHMRKELRKAWNSSNKFMERTQTHHNALKNDHELIKLLDIEPANTPTEQTSPPKAAE